jgi:hypothetical protein
MTVSHDIGAWVWWKPSISCRKKQTASATRVRVRRAVEAPEYRNNTASRRFQTVNQQQQVDVAFKIRIIHLECRSLPNFIRSNRKKLGALKVREMHDLMKLILVLAFR